MALLRSMDSGTSRTYSFNKGFALVFPLLLGLCLIVPMAHYTWESGNLYAPIKLLTSGDRVEQLLLRRSKLLGAIEHFAATLRYRVFGVSPNPTFYLGNDGWFVRKQGRFDSRGRAMWTVKALEDQMGMAPMTQAELDHWVKTLEERHRYLENKGVKYVISVIPRKSSIYEEEIFGTELSSKVGTTRLDQLSERLASHPFLNYVDMQEALAHAKKSLEDSSTPLYLKTDGHWNHLGAYFGYKAIQQKVDQLFPERPLEPVSLAQFKITNDNEWCHLGFSKQAGLCVKEPLPRLIPQRDNPLLSMDSTLWNEGGKVVNGPLVTQGVGATALPLREITNSAGRTKRYHYLRSSVSKPLKGTLLLSASFGEKMSFYFGAHADQFFQLSEALGFNTHLLENDTSEEAKVELVIQVFPQGIVSPQNKLHNRKRITRQVNRAEG